MRFIWELPSCYSFVLILFYVSNRIFDEELSAILQQIDRTEDFSPKCLLERKVLKGVLLGKNDVVLLSMSERVYKYCVFVDSEKVGFVHVSSDSKYVNCLSVHCELTKKNRKNGFCSFFDSPDPSMCPHLLKLRNIVKQDQVSFPDFDENLQVITHY